MSDPDPCAGSPYPILCRAWNAVAGAIRSPIMPDEFALPGNPALERVNQQLSAMNDASLQQQALVMAQGLHEAGIAEPALKISEAIPHLAGSGDASHAAVLKEAMAVRTQVIETIGRQNTL